jgi:FOG: WD40-like repeat
MVTWNRALAHLFVLTVAMTGCRSQEAAVVESAPAPVDEAARLRTLEAAMARVAAKVLWSGRYLRDVQVKDAVAEGRDLVVTVFRPATREWELHCIDLGSREPRWVVVLGDAPPKFPPRAGDRFVVVLLEHGAGMVVVDRHTGARQGRLHVPLDVIPSGPAGSSESSVYLASLVDDRVHAVSPTGGQRGWALRVGGTPVGGVLVTPAPPSRMVVAVTQQGMVTGFPAVAWDGVPPAEEAIWHYRLLGTVAAAPAVARTRTGAGFRNFLLVPCEDHGLYCLDAASGEPRWVHRTEAPFAATPAAGAGLVFARNAERLVVLSLETGDPAWKPSEPGTAPLLWEHAQGLLAVDGEHAYLDLGRGLVGRFDAKTGAFQARAVLHAFDLVVPTKGEGLLVGLTRDGFLVVAR